MKIYPLYSSSSGNLFYLENNDTSILIDIGVSFKNIKNSLENINKTLDDINGIIITHEHSDHVKGLEMICKHTNIPIYTCYKTKNVLDLRLYNKNIKSNIIPLKYDESFNINSLNITPFKISHDAVMPCGYYIKDNQSSISFATDLGYVSDYILNNYLNKSNYIVIEANYDKIMLEYGNYPYEVKERIKSNFGHLSNEDTAKTIFNVLSNNKDTSFLVSHLSINNNTEALAKASIFDYLNNNGINEFNINFATKDASFEEYIF